MIGGKLQLMGNSRISKSAGHKASVGILMGGNEHETDDASVEFELTGREYIVSYGYRISESVLPYATFSYAEYTFEGKVASTGMMLEYVTNSRSAVGGIEFSFDAFFAKLEGIYQQLLTSDTKDRTRVGFGYSLGYQW